MINLFIELFGTDTSIAANSLAQVWDTALNFIGISTEWVVSTIHSHMLAFNAIMGHNLVFNLPEWVIYLALLIVVAAIWIAIRLHKKLIKRSNEVKFRSGILESANRLLEELLDERQRAEEALKESELTFRTLFEQSTDSLALLDNNKFTDCNRAMLKLFGSSHKNDIIGHTPWELSPSIQFCGVSSEEKGREIIIETLEKGNNRFEWIHTKVDGTNFPAEVVLTLFNFKGKNILHVSLRDISVRKRMEKALIESEENYRLLVENQTDLVVKVDTEGHFLFVSPSYCKFFGKTPQELLGNSFIPMVHPDDVKSTKLEMEKLHVPPYYCKIEQRALTPQGWKWVSWTDTAVMNGRGQLTAIIGVGRDITERKRAEQQLMELNNQLEKRLAESSERLKRLNHEIEISTDTVSLYFGVLLKSVNDFSTIAEDICDETRQEDLKKLQSVIQEYILKIEILISNFQTMSHTWRDVK